MREGVEIDQIKEKFNSSDYITKHPQAPTPSFIKTFGFILLPETCMLLYPPPKKNVVFRWVRFGYIEGWGRAPRLGRLGGRALGDDIPIYARIDKSLDFSFIVYKFLTLPSI